MSTDVLMPSQNKRYYCLLQGKGPNWKNVFERLEQLAIPSNTDWKQDIDIIYWYIYLSMYIYNLYIWKETVGNLWTVLKVTLGHKYYHNH